MAEIIPSSDARVVDLAVGLLREGELVAYPTDTVYGLGALASNDEAVRRLFAVKGRPPTKALPLLLADSAMASWIAEITPVAHTLISQFWPGPVTIVLRKRPEYRSAALSGGNTLALRVPDHTLVRSIINGLREPVTGTSANRAGARLPVSAAEVAFQLGEMVPFVIDGGPSRRAVESTVVDTTAEDGPRVLREGAVPRDEIERVLGRPVG